MRVLHQLITHFWQRGVLTKEQADYLVEHGFIWARDLEFYEPPEPPPVDEEPSFTDWPASVVDLRPDRLEQKQEALAAPSKGKRRSGAPRKPDYSLAQLGNDLRTILRGRETLHPSLANLVGPESTAKSIDETVANLRGVAQDAFQRRTIKELRVAPGLLAKWWECLDSEPLHALVLQPKVRGPVARDFELILTATSPAEWRPAAWLLKVPEVQTVVNLLAVQRRLAAAIRWLDEKHRTVFNRCMQRPLRPARSWAALGFGLVLVYNARAWRAGRKPLGYALQRTPPVGAWREAWITAMGFHAEPVVPYCVHLFGNLPGRGVDATDAFAPKDELICPSEWKV